MNLIPSDVGRPMSHIRFNLRYEALIEDVRSVIDRLVPKEFEVQSEEGKYFAIRILPYRTKDNFIDGAVLTFIDITSLKELQEKQQENYQFLENIINSVRDPMVILNGEMKVIALNRSFTEKFQVEDNQTKGISLDQLGNGQWNIKELRAHLNTIIEKSDKAEENGFDNFIVEHHFPEIGFKRMKLHGRHLINKHGQKQDHLLLLTIEDVTSRQDSDQGKDT